MSDACLWSTPWRLNCFFISSHPLLLVGLSLCVFLWWCVEFSFFIIFFEGEGVSYRLCGLSD